MDSSFFALMIWVAAIGFFTVLSMLLFMVYKKFRCDSQKETMASSFSQKKTMASSLPYSSAPYSSSSSSVHRVFSSFSSLDVPISFRSRIFKELRRKGFDPFVDNEIDRCVTIGPRLKKAIEESENVLVMLSKNYASSSWSLNELVEIMNGEERMRSTVVALFWELNPYHVTNQTGDFGKIFRKTCKGKTKEDIERWKQALEKVARIDSYYCSHRDNEAAMIEKIVTDMSRTLRHISLLRELDGFVGMDAHIEKMEQMLCLGSDEARMIGIWGPLGIGKTTIARVLFTKHSHQFQLSAFIANIKARERTWQNESNAQLENQILSQLFNENSTDEILHLRAAQKRLEDKKVLLVLDDVASLGQLDALSFGPGSRIIITTQEKPRLLKSQGIKHIYKVDFPSPEEALQIFCMYCFHGKSPLDGFLKFSQEITTLSGKYPCGLRFMGSYLRYKSIDHWKYELPRLRTNLDGEIRSIIKFTYNSLWGEEKELSHYHISCLRDGILTKIMEEYLTKGFEEVTQERSITNQDLKEDFYASERDSEGISNGLLHSIDIYCADTLQYSFASHLSLEFRRKGIYAFIDCIENVEVVEGASASVVVLSKSCFSSTSFLENLVTILQCLMETGQLVVPVFYGISPSDVALQEHELQEHESADPIRWSNVLHKLILPGYQFREGCNECGFVEEIVKDVYEKLFPTEQIGINSRLLEIEQLLCKQPWGIRRIGIWGMPGIGKTTLAKAVFDQISGGYEASCFIKHFDKAFHEKGFHCLLEEHFGKILKELPRICSSITRPSLPGDKLSKKRTLVVLDDVHNPLLVESFLGRLHWFGPGSLIIITSRDKQIFRLCQIKHVYEVQSLNENESLQLFSQHALGEGIREQNFLELSMEVIDYANGNPLALSIYGGELKGKKLSEMETVFHKLKLRTPIHDLFNSSYETLNDNEKDIFLDIACFFKGEDVDHVMQLLEGCGFFPHVGIDVLVDKCLVTISENRVNMHNLIQDFGREIINGETILIERRRRLWESWSIKFLLEDDKLEANGYPKRALGTEDIEGIFLDTSNLLFDVKPTAFENMLNLRFLKIYCSTHENQYGLRLSRGLESLPHELRLLHWENYPLQSLPQDFDPGHLVELNMSYSQLQILWRGTKNLDMLKMVRLCHSQQLTEIGDICIAQNIELIDLKGCTKLQSFPATGQLQHLRVVNLSGCREIKSFSEVSPNIEELDLQGTSIRELPISIGNATNLKKLYLTGCASLVKLPSSIGNSTNLQILDLSNCSSLRELPSSIGNATNLEILNLAYCSSLVELPSSIGNATNLKKLCLTGCSSLVELPSSLRNATNLMVELPSSTGNITHVKNLCLSSNLDELPSSIKNSTSLISIDLDEKYNLPIVTVSSDNLGSRCIEVSQTRRGKLYVLKGELTDKHSVSLHFRLLDENGYEKIISFPFYQESDTASKVSSEMVEDLQLTDLNVTFIAALIDILLVNLIPTWKTDVPVKHLINLQLDQNS